MGKSGCSLRRESACAADSINQTIASSGRSKLPLGLGHWRYRSPGIGKRLRACQACPEAAEKDDRLSHSVTLRCRGELIGTPNATQAVKPRPPLLLDLSKLNGGVARSGRNC